MRLGREHLCSRNGKCRVCVEIPGSWPGIVKSVLVQREPEKTWAELSLVASASGKELGFLVHERVSAGHA